MATTPFRWDWDSHQCPLDVAIPFAATYTYSFHVEFDADRANNFIEHIQHIH